MTAKPEIVKYAMDSFAYFRRAIRLTNAGNALEVMPHPFDQNMKTERLALIVGYISHGWEHYGQMVVYQRIVGIVPPPSRSG